MFEPDPNIELDDLPNADLVRKGIDDLGRGVLSEEALLVIIASPRLRFLGMKIPSAPALTEDGEMALYHKLVAEGRSDAYSYYNSLLRAIISFAQGLERRRGAELRAKRPLVIHPV